MKWLSDIKNKLHLLINKYKGYQLMSFRHVSKNQLIVCMNQENMKNGLADRLKGIISSYVLAVENNRVFKINHTAGFKLEDYLVPNEYDWRIEETEVATGLNHVRVIHDFLLPLPKLKSSVAQYHVKSVFDVLEGGNMPYDWTEVFLKLFRPSPYLLKLIDDKKKNILGNSNRKYIAVHTRFINALEFNEPSDISHLLSHHQKVQLIDKCLLTIADLRQKYPNFKVLIFSDSGTFLRCRFPKGCIPMIDDDDGSIAHIGFSPARNSIDKAFIDLFIISGAEYVYNIVGKHMYPSGFCKCAAKISGSYFSRITYS